MWSLETLPDLGGKVCAVTGATNGIGKEVARGLAAKGANVVVLCRDPALGARVEQEIEASVTGAELEVVETDLTSFASVRAGAAAISDAHDRLDLLVNNAGVMAVPYRRTEDGFEEHLQVNYLAHFLLTGLLMPLLRRSTGARVVNLSSLRANEGHIDFEHLDPNDGYRKSKAYAQSKLATLCFAFELDGRLREAGIPIMALAAHPGAAATNLTPKATQSYLGPFGPGLVGRGLGRLFNAFLQPAAQGAIPVLHAAAAHDVAGGQYWGPAGRKELEGTEPALARVPAEARDEGVRSRLWEVSAALVGLDPLST